MGKSIVQILAQELQKEFPGAKGYSAANLWRMRNFYLTVSEDRRVQAKLAVKDEYTFDFAELSPEYSEHELEMQLVNNIRAFLIEMGGDFTFIGNQYHLMAGNRDLYIDLLVFHRRLKKSHRYRTKNWRV